MDLTIFHLLLLQTFKGLLSRWDWLTSFAVGSVGLKQVNVPRTYSRQTQKSNKVKVRYVDFSVDYYFIDTELALTLDSDGTSKNLSTFIGASEK